MFRPRSRSGRAPSRTIALLPTTGPPTVLERFAYHEEPICCPCTCRIFIAPTAWMRGGPSTQSRLQCIRHACGRKSLPNSVPEVVYMPHRSRIQTMGEFKVADTIAQCCRPVTRHVSTSTGGAHMRSSRSAIISDILIHRLPTRLGDLCDWNFPGGLAGERPLDSLTSSRVECPTQSGNRRSGPLHALLGTTPACINRVNELDRS